jgi:hypothetical protein
MSCHCLLGGIISSVVSKVLETRLAPNHEQSEDWAIPLPLLKPVADSTKVIYFNSDRDGFTGLWAVRLDPSSKKPVADPYAVKHFHGSPRHYSWYPGFGVGPERIIISLEQVQSDLWMTQLPDGK